jgi:hypothetical protein
MNHTHGIVIVDAKIPPRINRNNDISLLDILKRYLVNKINIGVSIRRVIAQLKMN